MALNSGSLNSHVLNGAPEALSGVIGTGSATINIEQAVLYKAAAASQANIVQVVELRETATGSLVNIEQVVLSKATPTINVEQVVTDAAETNTFFSRNGYEPRLYLDGVRIPNDEIHGQIRILFQEDDAPQLEFTLLPGTGVQDLREFRGKPVYINVREGSSITRLFTGKVNEPSLEIINQRIHFKCSLDIEQEVEDNVSRGTINSVGLYNNNIFSEPETKLQELQDRISTVTKVLDWDRNGSLMINNIAAKSSADYTLGDSDVYRESLGYQFASRQKYINKVKINAKFNFQRLHHYQITFSATASVGNFCAWLTRKATPCRRELIYSAANGAGWPITNMTFTPFYASDYYNCSGATVAFITTTCNKVTTPKTDSSGNAVTVDGNKVYESVETGCSNKTDAYCLGASWVGSKHFAQNISRQYTLSIEAPQSIADYGEKLKEEHYTLNDDYNAGDWERYEKYDNTAPDGLTKTGTSGSNFWIDVTNDLPDFNESALILMNRAKANIIKSHRTDMVMFRRSLWSAVQLSDTVRLNCTRVTAKGKVHNYEHIIDCNSGEAYTQVTLALSRASGSTSETDIKLPSIDMSSIDPIYPITSIGYGANYGIDASQQSNPSGFYGNHLQSSGFGNRLTNVPVTFVVNIPEIPNTLRKERIATDTSSFNVAIPNDELSINFTGKY